MKLLIWAMKVLDKGEKMLQGYKSIIAGISSILTGLGMIAKGISEWDWQLIGEGWALALFGLSVLGVTGKIQKLINVTKSGTEDANIASNAAAAKLVKGGKK